MHTTIQIVEKHNAVADINDLIERSSSQVPALKERRKKAFESFSNQPLPNRKIEHWKYNETSFLSNERFELSSENSSTPIETNLDQLLKNDDATICVFIDGRLSTQLSSDDLQSNVKITPFTKANSDQIDIISSCLDQSHSKSNLLVQLNMAVCNDGFLIEIEENKTLKKPIYIIHKSLSSLSQQLTTGQLIVYCGKNSRSEIIEQFQSELENKGSLATQESILYLSEDSQCDHYRLNLESSSTRHASRVLTLLDEKSELNSFYFTNGCQFHRTDIDVIHQGEYSRSNLTGIYLPAAENKIDYHTNIEHRVPHCTSRETFRGIIDDSAEATFSGKIHIFKDAQKSDAQLSNKNLLLTNQAVINTKPELEIYADDVVCAHGATVAKIDEKAVYYLQTRGIDKKTANRMLSIGFINQLIEKFENLDVKQFVERQVQLCLTDNK